MAQDKRIAIVYDWFDKWGGVERLLLNLHEILPQAVFFTSYYDDKKANWAKNLQIKTSFIQRLPPLIKRNRLLSLPFYPYAFESFDFSAYETVISVSSSFAKAIITKPSTFHIGYLLTPTRFLWIQPDIYQNKLVQGLASGYTRSLCQWDFVAAQRPDKIISISKTVKDRCQKYYQRESKVVYPPFDIEYWKRIKSQNSNLKTQNYSLKLKTIENKKYYLVVSRLEPYKRVDLVIKVFNERQNMNLVIVGKGSLENNLTKMADDNIYFLKDISDVELAYLYKRAEGLIMPPEEDFGYVALEAQFFGCPVIAYGCGGAKETVIDGQTGVFFTNQTEESLLQALARFNTISYNLKKTTDFFSERQVEKFSKKLFEEKFKSILFNI